MDGGSIRRFAVGAAALLASFTATAQPARAPTLQAMRGVEGGRWLLRERDAPASTARERCVRDPSVLLQLRHSGTMCTRFVLADGPRRAIVHYTCPGAGHVRTSITVDTVRTLRIESEGVAGGMPFADAIEARRLGACRAPAR